MNALSKRFLPVIHCVDPRQLGVEHAVYNIRIACDNSVDGVFLIGHNLHYVSLCYIYSQVRKRFPNAWIGINFLDIADETELALAVNKCSDLNALWMDNIPKTKLLIQDSVQVFGGVAFKYINPDQSGDELETACKEALRTVDVITTSGNQTESAPDIAKLREIRNNIGQSRLALASGISTDNVLEFLPFVNDFLVASSIIESVGDSNYEYLTPKKVRRLATIIHG